MAFEYYFLVYVNTELPTKWFKPTKIFFCVILLGSISLIPGIQYIQGILSTSVAFYVSDLLTAAMFHSWSFANDCRSERYGSLIGSARITRKPNGFRTWRKAFHASCSQYFVIRCCGILLCERKGHKIVIISPAGPLTL